MFQDPPVQVTSGSMAESKWIDNSVYGLKIVTCIVTFLVVLVCAAISKGTLLFIVSQITFNATRPYCNRDLGMFLLFSLYRLALREIFTLYYSQYSFG